MTNTTPDMRLIREEIFGPVGSVIPFDDEDEVLAVANDMNRKPRPRPPHGERTARRPDLG